MKIGIDIDGVVANFVGAFLGYYNSKNGKSVKVEDVTSYYDKVYGETREDAVVAFRDFFGSEYSDKMELEKGAFDAVNFLDDNHEIVFITGRSEEYRGQTLSFFKRHFPEREFEVVFVGGELLMGDKGKVCNDRSIDLMIEDNPRDYVSCVDAGTKCILINKPWNKDFEHELLVRCDGWGDVLGEIEKMRGEDGCIEKYFEDLAVGVTREYGVAGEARKLGLDPVDEVECSLAMTLAEKSVGLIKTVYPKLPEKKISARILELEEEYGQLNTTVSFVIAREIAEEKFCKFDNQLEAIDVGLRVGFAYMTLGVVASPIEGYTGLKLGKTKEGKDYFVVSFSGPIRSAGTTSVCVFFMLVDYLREHFGYAKYDPSEDEVGRYVTENTDFHERVSNLQYFPTEEEMRFLASHLPFQVDGDPTDRREVSNYKDLPRVATNFIRGGMCLAFSEGLAQKAGKAVGRLRACKENGLVCTGFDWLEDYLVLHKKREGGDKDTEATYIKDLVAGRPVYGHPSRSGGFRFRYGRGRTAGFSAVSIHPATMGVSNGFLSHGTQLKIEKPTKGCVITSCDSIDGPIVKLKDGSVCRVKDYEEGKKLYPKIDEIIYLGDILFPVGDVIDRNADLPRAGYVEEWWAAEVSAEKIENKKWELEGEDIPQKAKESSTRLSSRGNLDVGFGEAVKISKETGVALHPKFIFYWSQISNEEFLGLVGWLNKSVWREGKLVLPWAKSEREKFDLGKRALELLGVEHKVFLDNVVVDGDARAFLFNLGKSELYNGEVLEFRAHENEERGVLEIVNEMCEFVIKDKAGSFIGARMGRPEKAKLRALTGSPNALFPVSDQGGRLRSVQEAMNFGFVNSEFPIYKCGCGNEGVYRKCEVCGERGVLTEEGFSKRRINVKDYFDDAVKGLGYEDFEVPPMVKGIRRMSSDGKDVENLAKGILRAKFNLSVNKDGTVRYDGTEIPLTHFKPKEIRTSVSKLRELGYGKDIDGKDLIGDDQILELFPHDIVLSSCSEGKDERADDVFFNIANFVDEELERFYKLPRFYNLKEKKDVVGELVVCMAPHNCAGVVGRIIGFTEMQGLLASPYMHAAMRRDCFDYNTFITICENGKWKNVKIGEMVEEKNPADVVDGFGTKEIKVENCKTIGFDKKVSGVDVNNFTRHEKRGMYRVKTSLGKEISVTENHKFLVEGELRRMQDLKIGDRLPLTYNIDIESKDKKEINLLEELRGGKFMVRGIGGIVSELGDDEIYRVNEKLGISKSGFMNFKLRDSYPSEFVFELDKKVREEICRVGRLAVKRDTVEVPIIVKLDDELLEVVGLYVAEGFSRSVDSKKGLNQVDIASSDENLKDKIRRVIFRSFGLKSVRSENTRVMFSSKILYLFFTKILGCGSAARQKRIPSMFLDLPLDRLACILRGYYEGDGSVSLSDRRVSCDSVSEGLLFDLEFCMGRFGIFLKRYKYKKKPGPKVREFYIRKKREIPEFEITKMVIGSDFVSKFSRIGFLSERKKGILDYHLGREGRGMRINYDENFVYDAIVDIEYLGERESYCLNVDTENHLIAANSIVSRQCDGDEAAVMMLMDVLLNFSQKFLPSHRGGRQDAPLVLNARIRAGEVDDQILFFETCGRYPLSLYEAAESAVSSSQLAVGSVELVKDRLKAGGDEPFVGAGFTHDTSDINLGNTNGAYKVLPTMKEKVAAQMELVGKIRAVDTDDVARLVLERHFIRDIKGNLRKFGRQGFRCSKCNEKFRRPPLKGSCTKCDGKIIFTISEGSIKKYLEPALELMDRYEISSYTKESVELTQDYIESIFGVGEKQVTL